MFLPMEQWNSQQFHLHAAGKYEQGLGAKDFRPIDTIMVSIVITLKLGGLRIKTYD